MSFWFTVWPHSKLAAWVKSIEVLKPSAVEIANCMCLTFLASGLLSLMHISHISHISYKMSKGYLDLTERKHWKKADLESFSSSQFVKQWQHPERATQGDQIPMASADGEADEIMAPPDERKEFLGVAIVLWGWHRVYNRAVRVYIIFDIYIYYIYMIYIIECVYDTIWLYRAVYDMCIAYPKAGRSILLSSPVIG